MDFHHYASYVIPCCWVVLFGYWLAAAVRAKAVVEKQSLGQRTVIRAMVITSYFLLFCGWRDVPFMGVTVIPRSSPAALIGMVVCVSGVLIAVWARYVLAGNWSGNITLKQDHELIERGPYAWVRHPIYTGIFLMFLRTAIASGGLGNVLGLLLISLAMIIKYRQEEALMLRHFPDQYPAYMRRTKRLIPGVL
jgi:protein-S-isoprenylcysteine O-methyltransferase Ste14